MNDIYLPHFYSAESVTEGTPTNSATRSPTQCWTVA